MSQVAPAIPSVEATATTDPVAAPVAPAKVAVDLAAAWPLGKAAIKPAPKPAAKVAKKTVAKAPTKAPTKASTKAVTPSAAASVARPVEAAAVKPVKKVAARSAGKVVAPADVKVAAKPAKKPDAKSKGKAVTVLKDVKADVKVDTKAAATPAPVHEKVIRDGFTMPSGDYAKLKALKAVCLKQGVEVKKSELLRAGLHALEALTQKELLARVQALAVVKAGRKKS